MFDEVLEIIEAWTGVHYHQEFMPQKLKDDINDIVSSIEDICQGIEDGAYGE